MFNHVSWGLCCRSGPGAVGWNKWNDSSDWSAATSERDVLSCHLCWFASHFCHRRIELSCRSVPVAYPFVLERCFMLLYALRPYSMYKCTCPFHNRSGKYLGNISWRSSSMRCCPTAMVDVLDLRFEFAHHDHDLYSSTRWESAHD